MDMEFCLLLSIVKKLVIYCYCFFEIFPSITSNVCLNYSMILSSFTGLKLVDHYFNLYLPL